MRRTVLLLFAKIVVLLGAYAQISSAGWIDANVNLNAVPAFSPAMRRAYFWEPMYYDSRYRDVFHYDGTKHGQPKAPNIRQMLELYGYGVMMFYDSTAPTNPDSNTGNMTLADFKRLGKYQFRSGFIGMASHGVRFYENGVLKYSGFVVAIFGDRSAAEQWAGIKASTPQLQRPWQNGLRVSFNDYLQAWVVTANHDFFKKEWVDTGPNEMRTIILIVACWATLDQQQVHNLLEGWDFQVAVGSPNSKNDTGVYRKDFDGLIGGMYGKYWEGRYRKAGLAWNKRPGANGNPVPPNHPFGSYRSTPSVFGYQNTTLCPAVEIKKYDQPLSDDNWDVWPLVNSVGNGPKCLDIKKCGYVRFDTWIKTKQFYSGSPIARVLKYDILQGELKITMAKWDTRLKTYKKYFPDDGDGGKIINSYGHRVYAKILFCWRNGKEPYTAEMTVAAEYAIGSFRTPPKTSPELKLDGDRGGGEGNGNGDDFVWKWKGP